MKSYQIIKVISFLVLLLFLNSCATSNTSIQTPPPDMPLKALTVSTIQGISFTEEENCTRIRIEGSEALETPFYKLVSDPLVKKIAEVKREEETVKEKETELPPPELKKEGTPPVEKAAAPETLKKAKEILNVSLDRKKDSITYNIVADGALGNYNVFKMDSPPRLVLDIWEVGTRYPKHPIKTQNPFIKKVRIGQHPDKLRFVFECLTPQLPPYQINRMDEKLMVSFGNVLMETRKEEPKKEEAKKEEEKPIPELKKAEKVAPPVEEKRAPEPQVTKRVEEEKKVAEEAPSEKVYTGRKLSLDFKDADIKNILRLIAEVSNFNIIAGDDVTGKITMRLADVPWDQALDVILQARSLGMTKVGNVIRIAPLNALKKEIQAELEAKRAKEKLEDLVTELIPVNYATAKEVQPQVKSILSDRGDVKVDDRTNILIVKDIARNIVAAKNLVKSLDTKTPQVLIEARIVEANLTFQRELGISWGLEIGGGKATLKGGLSDNRLVDLPAEPKTGAGSAGILEFLFTRGTIRDLDMAISAHEIRGDVKIISSPKIATLDNKEASIEQGLRIPYLRLTTEGTVTTEFIDANLKLTVTPHVTNDGNIKLSIKAKKDAPDTSIVVQGVPSIDKKEAITEVLIKDSGVVAIAGIYTIEKNIQDEGIPLFKKIPVLGWLFKREAKEDKRKDLLIFISPKIIKDVV